MSIDQKSTSRNPRSTVGTITEVYDYLRLLFARIGKPHCPRCGAPIPGRPRSRSSTGCWSCRRAPASRCWRRWSAAARASTPSCSRDLQTKGYARARVDGDGGPAGRAADAEEAGEAHHRGGRRPPRRSRRARKRRLTDSVETALQLAGGMVMLEFVDLPEDDPDRERLYSEHLYCPYDDLSFEELEPRSFSFNSPFGACPECTGLGTRMEVDPELIVPDPERTLDEGAIAPWSRRPHQRTTSAASSRRSATRWASASTPRGSGCRARRRRRCCTAHDEQVHVRYSNRYGRERSYYTDLRGRRSRGSQRRHAEAESDASRERFEGYMREVPCPACKGARLKPVSLAVTVGGRSHRRRLRPCRSATARSSCRARAVRRATSRSPSGCSRRSTPGWASCSTSAWTTSPLDRAAGTLAGGEAQRIRLATQIGSGLVGVLYVLDEPSIGLHQRDNHRLIETLVRLRDMGNTLIVVEHDEDTIDAADWVVDIGPGAGEHGGQVVVLRHGAGACWPTRSR